ncbi:MAG TPA: SDR family oxidoreductase [Dokdonella sp.]|uniref:SDR family oxidoreductase n=1 Tax=Dokdonella sp. TaxID=2291710 RepID=UPI002BC49CF9|nr:SDR family oxidoreductase [Dokdonella sp.]HUD43428.1 SDR family oxidoreductase [Dokdonella sp.]
MTELHDKVVWITGASGGIGEALAYGAAARGARLVLTARRDAELERVRAACPDPARVALLPADLERIDDAQALADRAQAFFGPVDVLVNNAGLSQRTTALETSLASYRRLFEIDFFAPIALTRALLPAMAARGSGHVVVVSSVFGKIAMARRTGYAAAKHALHGYYDCARIELGDRGVRFTLACPGFVSTAISLNALGPEGRAWGTVDSDIGQGMTPAACAERIWRAVERDRYEVVIAGRERVAVWFKRFLPLRWYTAFARRLKVS